MRRAGDNPIPSSFGARYQQQQSQQQSQHQSHRRPASNVSTASEQRRFHSPEQQQHQQHRRCASQHRSPASSLIQSAVRSILDDATPSTVRSETGSDFGGGDTTAVPSSSLSSLQMKRMPALPDEQDRKRFIGCLAAILASSYDYDESDESVLDNEAYKDSLLFVDSSETDRSMDAETVVAVVPFATKSSFEYTDVDEISDSTSTSDTMVPVESKTTSRQQQQQAKQKDSPLRQSTSQPSTKSMWGTSAKAKALLAQERHRQRRYHVLSRLLVQSADLLLLDPSAAKAFLPMLDRVLNPRPKSRQDNEKPPLWRRGANPKSTDDNPPPEEDSSPTLPTEYADDGSLQAFLGSLTPGSGIRCLSLLLLQYLLTSEVGYDARIRHAIRKLGVVVLVRDMEHDPVEPEIVPADTDYCMDPLAEKLAMHNARMARATRKFESLEHSIARRIIRLSESSVENGPNKNAQQGQKDEIQTKYTGLSRQQILRGVKIGSAGIVAGTLFALTGGIAAPGIAAGVAAIAGSTAATAAAVVTLTSTAVVTTIFGVGGGGLAAYKMQRRTQGLTEFEIRKESSDTRSKVEAELFSTICLSGWLRDKYDYQRPWGIHPSNPPLTDRVELLERFYSIHSPEHIPKCSKILTSWKGEEDKLWEVLREKYGTDPDHLFPLEDGPRIQGALTLEQEELLENLFVELGYNSTAPKPDTQAKPQLKNLSTFRSNWKERRKQRTVQRQDEKALKKALIESIEKPTPGYDMSQDRSKEYQSSLQASISADDSAVLVDSEEDDGETEFKPPKHLATVWDYQSTYGGELYTIKWESKLLKSICDCVMDLAMDMVSGATKQLLKQTVLNALLSAFTWPSYLINVANMIDGDWTLAVERSSEAGKELARTLLFSRAGHRPVTLIGFSFGARIIYACLKELANFQEDWEEYRDLKQTEDPKNNRRFAKMAETFEGMREPASVIEDVVLMGLPNHLSLQSWRACRQVVAGRLVNCYSRNDLILSLMYQVKRISGNFSASSVLKPVCGTCPIPVPGVENVDVSDLVPGHQNYCLVTRKILERVQHGHPFMCSTTTSNVKINNENGGNVTNVTEDNGDLSAAKKLDY